MSTNLDRQRSDLEALEKLGIRMLEDLVRQQEQADGNSQATAERSSVTFRGDYQPWYTEAAAVIRQVTQDRLAEFHSLYKGDGRPNHLISARMSSRIC